MTDTFFSSDMCDYRAATLPPQDLDPLAMNEFQKNYTGNSQESVHFHNKTYETRKIFAFYRGLNLLHGNDNVGLIVMICEKDKIR